MQEFSQFDRLENLRFSAFEIEQIIQNLIEEDATKQPELMELKQKFQAYNNDWERLYEDISEIAEVKIKHGHRKFKVAQQKRKIDREKLRDQHKALKVKDHEVKNYEKEFNKSLTQIQSLWNRGLSDMEIALNEQKQNRLRMESAHMRQLKRAEEEMSGLLNLTMPLGPRKTLGLSEIDSEDSMSSSNASWQDEDDMFTCRTPQNQLQFGLKLNTPKIPTPPGGATSNSQFQRQPFLSRTSEPQSSQMSLTERSNLSDMFNAIIDEEMANREGSGTAGSKYSMEKEQGQWNSDYDSEEDKSKQITKDDVKNALKVLNKGNLLSDKDNLGRLEAMFNDSQSSANLELMLQINSIKSDQMKKAMTPRDSRNFNAPVPYDESKHTTHRRDDTEEMITPEKIDELAITSPKNAIFAVKAPNFSD